MAVPGELFSGPSAEPSPGLTQEAELRTILESAHNGIIAVDTCGRITIFNQAAERLIGVSAKDVLGKVVTEVIPSSGLLQVTKGQVQVGMRLLVGDRMCITNRTPIYSGRPARAALKRLAGLVLSEFCPARLPWHTSCLIDPAERGME